MILTSKLIVGLVLFAMVTILSMIYLHRRLNRRRFRLVAPPTVILYLLLFFFAYTGVYYHADETAQEALKTTGSVQVTDSENEFFFDGPGTEDVLIFYPGAKVESQAYAPLLRLLAQQGVDCYLLKTPFHLAVLDTGEASDVDVSAYKHVYVSGHSMGGAVAGMYAAAHKDTLSGVIFLAAYPTKDLKQDGFRALSIVGTEDGGYDAEKWKEAEQYMPEDFEFIVMEGANHGDFGNYGDQSGDGQASISREDQQEKTAELMADFILDH